MLTLQTVKIAAIVLEAVLVISLGLMVAKIIRQVRKHNAQNRL